MLKIFILIMAILIATTVFLFAKLADDIREEEKWKQ
jgi:hypothetical protein